MELFEQINSQIGLHSSHSSIDRVIHATHACENVGNELSTCTYVRDVSKICNLQYITGRYSHLVF